MSPYSLADLKAACGSRPPTLMELLDTYGEAREEAGAADESGSGANWTLYTGYAAELREEIERRIDKMAGALVKAVNSLADTFRKDDC